MTEKELRRLTRSDLLEMLLSLSKENEKLKMQLEQANKQLEDRQIAIEKSGSLAEAALHLNGMFEAAQAACEQYIQNMRLRCERQDQICSQMERITQEKCNQLLARAKNEASACLAEAHQNAREQKENYAWLRELMQNDPTKQG